MYPYSTSRLHRFGRLTVGTTVLACALIAWRVAAADPAPGSDTVVISRTAPNLSSGRIEGTLRVLTGANFGISNTQITSALAVPGSPNLALSGDATVGATIVGGGNAAPTF